MMRRAALVVLLAMAAPVAALAAQGGMMEKPEARAQYGFMPSAAFFPLLPLDAAPDSEPTLMPVASNHPLAEDHASITRGIIVIHDFSRDANKILTTLVTLAGAANDSTMIMAPQFLLESDITRFAGHLPDKGKGFARWTIGGWPAGDDSLPAPQKGISSFTAVDLMLMYLADRASFPSLKEVVVMGNGDGGDFVQRYALAGKAPDILAKELPIRFVVANASSYLYLTTVRPRSGRQGFSPPDDGACKDFNKWPYGLDELNLYAKMAGANAMKMRFAERSIAYLVGEGVAKNDPAPDTGCAALLQGSDRPVRAMNYATYAGLMAGDAKDRAPTLMVEPGAGYDPAAVLGGKCGMALLFGDGDCSLQGSLKQ